MLIITKTITESKCANYVNILVETTFLLPKSQDFPVPNTEEIIETLYMPQARFENLRPVTIPDRSE